MTANFRCRCKHTTYDHEAHGKGACLIEDCRCKAHVAVGAEIVRPKYVPDPSKAPPVRKNTFHGKPMLDPTLKVIKQDDGSEKVS